MSRQGATVCQRDPMLRMLLAGWLIWTSMRPCHADESTAATRPPPTLAPGEPTTLDARLRALVRLPQVGFNVEPRFNRLVGVTDEDDVPDLVAELTRLSPTLSDAPTNAGRHLKLARMARSVDATPVSVRHQEAALMGFRATLESHPGDLPALVGLGQALWFSGDTAAAEKHLRTVTTNQPNAWAPWLALGDVLGARSLKVFTEWGDPAPPDSLPDYVRGELQPKGDAAEAKKLFIEADSCVERALKLAPEDPAMWAARVPFFLDREMRRRMLDQPTSARERAAAVSLATQTTALTEIEAALTHRPNDYRLIGLAIQLRILPELAAAGARINQLTDGRPAADFLRSETRSKVLAQLARLSTIATTPASTTNPPPAQAGPTPAQRAGAAEMAASYQLAVMGDAPAAVRLARLALELDPTRRQAFELCSAALVSENRWTELVELCQKRLNTHDEPLPRLIWAKAEFNAGKKAVAVTNLAAANEKFPHDRLLLAAWVAARLATGATNSEPNISARLPELFPDPARTFDPTDGNHSVVMSATITQALEGDLAGVKKALRSLLGANPQDEYAAAVLEAIRNGP